ncbi:MAG: hypothetical protein ACHQ51_02965 [Elusimicrobiota bacterium]
MKIRALILGALLTASWSEAARRTSRPAASELLGRALSAPAARVTRVRVQIFGPSGSSGKAKAQTRLVRVQAPGVFRIEVAGKKAGSLSLLAVGDGRRLLTAWPRAKRAWLGPAPDADAAAEKVRLESLYEMTVSTGGRTAKKPTWRLDMRSRADGGIRRSLWIAKDDGGVLRREDYRPDGTLMRRLRTTRLEEPAFSLDAFVVRAPDGTSVDSATVPFVAAPAGGARGAFPARFPRWLPDGFVLVEAAGGAARSATIVYSDGLTPVTFVERPSGEGAPPAPSYAEVRLKSGAGKLSFSGAGTSLSWTSGDRDYTETGDMPEADLARMADSIGEKP